MIIPTRSLAVALVLGGALPLVDAAAPAHAQCPQINIGTRDNPRFVRDPACGNPTTSSVNAQSVRERRARQEFEQRRRGEDPRQAAHSRRR